MGAVTLHRDAQHVDVAERVASLHRAAHAERRARTEVAHGRRACQAGPGIVRGIDRRCVADGVPRRATGDAQVAAETHPPAILADLQLREPAGAETGDERGQDLLGERVQVPAGAAGTGRVRRSSGVAASGASLTHGSTSSTARCP